MNAYRRPPDFGRPDDDPHIWLEDLESARALGWVERQNAVTLDRFAGERFVRDRDALAARLDRPDRLPLIHRQGRHVYNFWRDEAHAKGVWRRTSLASFREPLPEWEVLFDLDALAAAEGEDWVFAGLVPQPPDHDRAIIRLSRGGADAVVAREFDIHDKRFVEDGFRLPESKSHFAWLDKDTLLVASALGEGMSSRAGQARALRSWRRGERFEAAEIVFEIGSGSTGVHVSIDRTTSPPRCLVREIQSSSQADLWIGSEPRSLTRLETPSDARKEVRGDWLLIEPTAPWEIGGATHAAGALLGIRLSRFLDGARDFHTLFTPADRRSLSLFGWCGDKLVLSTLDDLNIVYEILTPGDEEWAAAVLPGAPSMGHGFIFQFDGFDENSDGAALLLAQGPLTAPSLSLANTAADVPAAPIVLKQSSAAFDASGLMVTRHEAISIDGERIPYFQMGPEAAKGDALVHMSGYGGFGVSHLPYYDIAVGKLWLERGGVGVVAGIRGGGEFGTRWHHAGYRENKRVSHADFAAVASDLVARGVTRPRRIGAEGLCNGGLLMANMLTRYPERFGALLCEMPLIDMRRYSRLLDGASWIDEYGDPEKPEEWAFLREISAYHVAAPGRPYPPVLLTTSRRDDRTHPGHARKMAAKLQAMGYEAYFHETASGGHWGGGGAKGMAAFRALGLNFLWETLSAN